MHLRHFISVCFGFLVSKYVYAYVYSSYFLYHFLLAQRLAKKNGSRIAARIGSTDWFRFHPTPSAFCTRHNGLDISIPLGSKKYDTMRFRGFFKIFPMTYEFLNNYKHKQNIKILWLYTRLYI